MTSTQLAVTVFALHDSMAGLARIDPTVKGHRAGWLAATDATRQVLFVAVQRTTLQPHTVCMHVCHPALSAACVQRWCVQQGRRAHASPARAAAAACSSRETRPFVQVLRQVVIHIRTRSVTACRQGCSRIPQRSPNMGRSVSGRHQNATTAAVLPQNLAGHALALVAAPGVCGGAWNLRRQPACALPRPVPGTCRQSAKKASVQAGPALQLVAAAAASSWQPQRLNAPE